MSRRGLDLDGVAVSGTTGRLRSVDMTAFMAMLVFLPAALSSGVGSEIAGPFIVVIIGGLVSAALLTLTVLPLIYRHFEAD